MGPPRTGAPADINTAQFVQQYGISGQLLEDLNDLIELRNEIIHPAHVPTGTPDNWPVYLTRVKTLGLLKTTGGSADYALLEQIASHRLFEWGIGVVQSLYRSVIMSDPRRAPMFIGFYDTFDSIWFKGLPADLLW